MKRATLREGLLLACLAAAPAAAATYETTMDFTGTSRDCIVNHNLTGRAFYSHLNASNCHSLEASWDGPFYSSVWKAPICKQGPNDTTCSNWGYGCCMTCSPVGTSNEHGSGDLMLGKAFAPGTYRQTLTVEPQVPGAPADVDKINAAHLELYFSETDFTDTRGCARQRVDVPAVLKTGDVWNIAVVIPDVGQTVRMDKDGAGTASGDGQEMLAGTTSKPFKVIVTKKVNGGATIQALQGLDVVFRLKDSAGTAVGGPLTAITGPDGRAQAAFPVQEPGPYSVEAMCAGCVGGSSAVFAFQVYSVEAVTELRLLLSRRI